MSGVDCGVKKRARSRAGCGLASSSWRPAKAQPRLNVRHMVRSCPPPCRCRTPYQCRAVATFLAGDPTGCAAGTGASWLGRWASSPAWCWVQPRARRSPFDEARASLTAHAAGASRPYAAMALGTRTLCERSGVTCKEHSAGC